MRESSYFIFQRVVPSENMCKPCCSALYKSTDLPSVTPLSGLYTFCNPQHPLTGGCCSLSTLHLFCVFETSVLKHYVHDLLRDVSCFITASDMKCWPALRSHRQLPEESNMLCYSVLGISEQVRTVLPAKELARKCNL